MESISEKGMTTAWQARFITILLFAVVCLTWGTTWLGIKIAVQTVAPLTSAGLRFLIAFPLFLLFAKVKKEPLVFPRESRGFFILIVLFYFVFPYFLINYGEQYVSSGLTALLFSTMPVFTLIFSSIFLRERVLLLQVVGIIIGFTCLLLILVSQGVELGYQGIGGAIAVLGAAVMHALCYVLTKKEGKEISVITFTTLPIGIAGLLLTVAGFVLEQPRLSEISFASLGALLYLGIVASVGGFITYFYLLKRLNPVVLSFVFILFPVASIWIGSWYEHTPISPHFALLCSVLLFGFALTKIASLTPNLKKIPQEPEYET